MRRMLAKGLVLMALAVASTTIVPANAQSARGMGVFALDPVDDGNSILTVSGTGIVSAAPDLAEFNAGVSTAGATAQKAMQENARVMAAVLKAAQAQGIPTSDIQTSSVRIEPVMSDDRNYRGPRVRISSMEAIEAAAMEVEEAVMAPAAPSDQEAPRIVGYRAENIVTIRQREVGDFGALLDALVAAGANTVDGPKFRLEDNSSIQDEARALAIADARRKADLQATAAGLRVTRIVMMDEGRVSGLSSRSSASFGFYEAMEPSTPQTSVEPGELQISATVNILFEATAAR